MPQPAKSKKPTAAQPAAQSTDKFGLDPEKVNQLLMQEHDGQLPEDLKSVMQELRGAGVLPPAMIKVPDEARGEMALPFGRVYTGFGAPPRQPEALPAAQPGLAKDIPETPKDTFFGGVAKAWDVGKGAVKAMADPEALAGMGAGIATAERSTPFGMLASGGATAGVAAAKELYKRSTDPEEMKKPLSETIPPIGEAFLTGATGELLSRGANAIRRPMVTPQGQAATQFFGEKNIMPQQMTDSSALNFMANVAKHGPGGQAVMKGAEEKQSQHVLEHLQEVSDQLNAQRGISVDPQSGMFNAGEAGKKVQRDVAGQLDQARKQSGFQQFLQQHGAAQEEREVVNPISGEIKKVKGQPVSKLQQMRSDALEMSRRADAAGDVKAQQEFLKKAQKLQDSINRALPDQAARDQYRNIAAKYASEMQRLDNPTVQAIREGGSNDVVDKILNSGLKNYAPFGSAATGQTNVELLGRMEKALSPNAWEQLQADAVHRLGERSIDPNTGMVSAKEMAKQLEKLDGPTKKKLFGKGLSDIEQTLNAVEQAQKFNKSEAGRLFVAIRYGGAGMTAAGATVGTGIAAARGDSKGVGAAVGTAAGAAAFLVSPYAFAKLLTSPVGRKVLTRALQSNTKTTVGRQARTALTRFIAQNVMEEGREGINSMDTGPVEIPEELRDFAAQGGAASIPEPPR